MFFNLIKRLASLHLFSWLLSHTLHRIDGLFLRLTNNHTSLTSLLTGAPVVVLITLGVKSGRLRRTPLLTFRDGRKVILIASNFGNKRNPAWYYNLIANPQVYLSWDGKTGEYQARETDGEEREKYWNQAVQLYAGYDLYRRRAGNRKIPVLVLEPQTGSEEND